MIRTIFYCSLLVAFTACADGYGSEYNDNGGAAAGAGGGSPWMDAGDIDGAGGSAAGAGGSSASGEGGYGGGIPMAGMGGDSSGEGGAWPGWDAGMEDGGAAVEDIVFEYGTNPDRPDLAAADRQAFDEALDVCLSQAADASDICADDRCDKIRTCCVGQGDCCQPTSLSGIPGVPLDLSACDGQEPAACLAGDGWPVEAFGPRQSQVHGDGFYPGGDATGDSGLRFEPLFDLQSQRVKVSAVFHPGTTTCGAGCLEGAGIGFGTQLQLPADATGDIALVYSRSLKKVRLVRGGMVVGQAAIEDSVTDQKWTLELQPSGRVLAYADDAAAYPAIDSVFEPASGSRLALFGRSENPSGADGVHLSALQVELELCDIPERWSERGALVLKRESGNQWQPEAASAPSAARDDDGNTVLAFESSGDIYLAVQDANDPYAFVLYGTGVTPIVDKSAVSGATALGHPSLVWDGNNWVVFFTVNRGAGVQDIASARAPSGGDFTLDEPLDFDVAYQGSLYAPSVARRWDGRLFMAASRNELTGDGLVFFESDDGQYWMDLPEYDGPGTVLARACDAKPGAFFCDGVGMPSLSIHNGAWQLYFAGKQGTRWAIGLLVSDVLTGWAWKLVPQSGEPVLEASGSGFDRLSVLHPAALESTDSVELFYAGSDGAGTALGRAFRAATSDGSF